MSVILFKLILVTYVPVQPTPLSLFVSQLYFSCKVMQLQLASIWQALFFFVQVQCWKVIFIGLISLKDNENRDCLQRLGLWKWSNQCFERVWQQWAGLLSVETEQHRSNSPSLTSSLRALMSSQIEDRVPYSPLLSVCSSLLEWNYSTLNRWGTCQPDVFE